MIHPKFGYGHPDCQLPPPKGLVAGEETHFVMQLLQLYPSVCSPFRSDSPLGACAPHHLLQFLSDLSGPLLW